MFKTRFISMLVLLCLTVSGAWAQEVTLLTTIENIGDNEDFTSGSKTFDNIATVTFSGNVNNDNDAWGWYSEDGERTLTVTAAEGYTITRVKFYTDEGSAFDEEAPFEAILVRSDYAKVNGTSIGAWGVNKIEVYGYAGTPAPAGYTVSMPQDTPDAEKWTARAGTDGTYQQLPLEGVAAGTAVSAKYSGAKKVKSVKAKKKKAAAAPAPTLAETLTTAGMTVKVNYNYNGDANYCLFVSNGDGTYTFQSGEGYAGGDKCAKALVVEGGKLVFKQNFFETIDDMWDMLGFSVTFDTSDNTYSQWVGSAAESSFSPSFTSVEVNGTQIAVTETNNNVDETGD